jgi:hypothetical protein
MSVIVDFMPATPAKLLGQITSVQVQIHDSVPALLRRDIQRLCKANINSLKDLLQSTGRQLQPSATSA